VAPTGVALRDPRQQLLDAGTRLLLRDGPAGLTSRSVTAEAGVAKGVLHRHFLTFEAFRAALVQAQVDHVRAAAEALRSGTGDVPGQLAEVLRSGFDPLSLAVVGLAMAHPDLRREIRPPRSYGVPVLSDLTEVLAGYLADEQRRGRVVAEADPGQLALMLVGTAHLTFSGIRKAPDALEARRLVDEVAGQALAQP